MIKCSFLMKIFLSRNEHLFGSSSFPFLDALLLEEIIIAANFQFTSNNMVLLNTFY